MKKISRVVALAFLLLIFSFMGARAERTSPRIEWERYSNDVNDYINSMKYARDDG